MRHQWSPRYVLSPLVVVLSALLAVPAVAQQEAVHWHKDLESAKAVAKQTGRLVLVHFWTPSCGPCMALNQTVFNQPGVANAIETQFVPVKLNADENSATATWYGITRVPTDVIVTPDGQMVAKLVSPPTPAAYVAEVTAAAGKYAAKSGQNYAKAAAAAPVPSQLNSAYSSLPVSPSIPLAVSSQQQPQPAAGATRTSSPFVPASSPLAANQERMALATPEVPVNLKAASPPVANPPGNVGIQPNQAAQAAPRMSPAAAPKQVNNPYMGLAMSTPGAQQPEAQQTPAGRLTSPAQTRPIGYDKSPLPSAAAEAAIVPPAMPAAASARSGQAAATNAAPDPRQLPPGAPALGFDGYCPVSMRNSWKWVAGDPRWGVVHRGHTYWFATAEEQRQFWTDPDRYTPALSGMDPVLALDHQQQVPGKREHSLDYDGLFYMFASEATLQQFTANPQRYATGVRQAMGIPRGRLVR
jgi:YHS domain-containing protein/thiol-disulfide isomerase/thioredoxin